MSDETRAEVRAALAWLEPRLAEVPDSLAETVRACVRGEAASAGGTGGTGAPDGPEAEGAGRPGAELGTSVPDVLARAGLGCLDGVAPATRARRAALELLAADACLTFAFEAAAELGEDVEALAERLGPRGALGSRLAAATGGRPEGSR